MNNIFGYTIDACRSALDCCEVCSLGKHTRFPFPNSETKSDKVLALLHLDVWGPYNTHTFDGNKFFLTIVDDFSRITWIFLLKLKSDILVVLKQFFRMVLTQFNVPVQGVRYDNGGKFVSDQMQALFKELGIIHYKTCVYTPQQNGVAEKKHRHIL